MAMAKAKAKSRGTAYHIVANGGGDNRLANPGDVLLIFYEKKVLHRMDIRATPG